MPRIKSAKKRMRQTRARTGRNRAARSELRTAIKQARAATGPDAAKAVRAAQAMIDRAGRKNLIHPNTANRTKSRLAKLSAKH